jgi:riboflavin biosynthesis pyrimidine reductase
VARPACAILTGIGTVLEDDPLLNVRGMDTPRQPHLVVVDSRLDMPLNANCWTRKARAIKPGKSGSTPPPQNTWTNAPR